MFPLICCILLAVCIFLGCHLWKLRQRLDAICNIADEFLADLEDPEHG
jgi:hypothetical protein